MNKVVIIVDLGHFKAYRVSKEAGESAKLELIESYDSLEAHGRLSEKLTDRSGNFGEGVGTGVAATGHGEAHNMETENQKRLIKLIAGDINAVITTEGCARWDLAAARAINSQVVENLDPVVKAKLHKNITADLTKTAKSEILGHFE